MFNLILLKRRADGATVQHAWHRPAHFVMLGLMAASVVGLAVVAGFYLGRVPTRPEKIAVPEVRDFDLGRGNAAAAAGADFSALSARLAELQSRVARLDALGRELIETTSIDAGEFDFEREPALGGPYRGSSGNAAQREDGLRRAIDALSLRLDDRERQLDVLASLLAERRLATQSKPRGEPIEQGWLSSNYGYREDPISGERAWHDGLDFAGAEDSPVLAVGAGVVTYAGKRWGYGQLVEITHGDGYVTRYGHNNKVTVEQGDLVHRGDKIAEMGSTGRSTGPHVHLEVLKDGESVNPWKYVQAGR